jgi:beta propeller domain-containing protein
MRRVAALLAALPVLVLAFASDATGRLPVENIGQIPPKNRLFTFGSCSDLLSYAKQNAAPLVTSYGVGDLVGVPPPPVFSPPEVISTPGGVGAGTPGAAPPAPSTAISAAAQPSGSTAPVASDYSTTNVQEAGVDEPDIVKTDGTHIFAVAQGKLHAIDARAAGGPHLLDRLQLQEGWSHELLLHGKVLLVLSRLGEPIGTLPAGVRVDSPDHAPQSTLAEVDVSDPAAMRIVRTLKLPGDYLSARLTGASARVVTTSSMPHDLQLTAPSYYGGQSDEAALARNRDVVSSSGLASWVPSYELEDVATGRSTKRPLVQCRSVRRPVVFSGLGMLTVLTLDLEKGIQPVDADAILADGQIVYASPRSVYVSTQRGTESDQVDLGEIDPAALSTAIHKFDSSKPGETEYRGSGKVEGSLLNQWSLSEHEGVLRVASTVPSGWESEGESFVTTLKEREGTLAELGRVGGLGKGESIFGVRFMGDVGYVVTFRQTDPLYTIDLSDPRRPRTLGELQMLGYSAYLHPLDEALLLGLGQDARDDGSRLGTQLSMFDVSNLRRPTRLYQRKVGSGSSEAESDHHAFLYWGPTRLAVVPVETPSFSGAVGFKVSKQRGIARIGAIEHPKPPPLPPPPPPPVAPPGVSVGSTGGLPSFSVGSLAPFYPRTLIHRSLVVGDAVLTLSDIGLKANDLRTFADRGWIAFE